MKKIDGLILMLGISYFLSGALVASNNQDGYQQVPPGTIFSITNNNSQNLEETTRTTHVTVNRSPKVTTKVPVHTYDPKPQPHYYHQSTRETYYDKPKYNRESQEYFSSYYEKFKEAPSFFTFKNGLITLAIVGCCYVALYGRLLQLSNNAKKTNGWGSFQEHIPPSDLNSLEPLALADGIIEEIKLRYPLINPTNLMPSLLLFNKDIEQELEELNTFINFYVWLTTYKLSALFPNQEKLVIKAQQKIQRLHILQDAITEWINKHVTRLMRNQPVPKQNNLTKRKSTSTIHRNKKAGDLLASKI